MAAKRFVASVCHHPCSKPGLALCRDCWKSRGLGADGGTLSYTASVCGHPCSASGLKYCRACYDKKRLLTIDSTGHTEKPLTLSVEGDTAEVGRITDQVVKTLADLIRVCEIDTDAWVIDKWVANKWEMGAKDADGSLVSRPLYQVKAWLKRNAPIIETKAAIAALIEDAKRQIAPRKPVTRLASGPHMLEVAIPDLHLGKLAWAPETGGDNYDSQIAADLFREALVALVERTRSFKYERVVLPIGNDFFHADTKQGTTTKGTPLDTDSRYHKTFVVGRRLMTWAIDTLRKVAPVEVVIVPGNHDTLAAFHLGDSLSCLYHNTPDVTIRNEPILHKYVDYGRNLILFTHSDKGKKDRLPLLMATEKPKLFGEALFREAHVGHTHETQLKEYMGVRVRVSPALCAADAWHSEQHFVGNLRSAEALVWSREDGIVVQATYTVRPSLEASA